MWGQLGQSAKRLPAYGACNKAQPGTRGHAPHCGFANGLGRLRGNSEYASGANFLRCLLPSATLAPQRFFIACCGCALRGRYSPLRAHPRKSRMPSQATSGWANVACNCPHTREENYELQNRPPREEREDLLEVSQELAILVPWN